eukprot:5857345-Pyramimonas_sp.AAC.1
MAVIAAAGCWPKTRKQDLITRSAGDKVCDRCREKLDIPSHRYWECSQNVGPKAYESSDEFFRPQPSSKRLRRFAWGIHSRALDQSPRACRSRFLDRDGRGRGGMRVPCLRFTRVSSFDFR